MTTKVHIHVTGLAVCYLDGAVWKIDFLCDDHHRLFFRHSGAPSDSIELGRSKNIEISVDSPVKTDSEKGKKFDEIFNMVSDAHPGGVDSVDPPPSRRRVSMTIPSAKLGSEKPTNKIYGIKRADRPSDPYRPLRKVSEIVGVEIELRAGGKITLKIDGTNHPLPVNNSGTLYFDNDCRPLANPNECRQENDSLLYYDLVKGRERPPVRYIFTRIEQTLTGTGKDSEKAFRTHPDGNCDPATVDPPPGAPPP